MFDLFDAGKERLAPLAERMRAESLSEFFGQEHLVGKDSLLRRAIQADRLGSCIFYGPPGTGKTTLANIIAKTTNSHYEQLNAVSSGVADAKRVIEEARNRLGMYGKKTYLLLDECHRWNKAQSDCVLSAVEKGEIIFIGSTTENPYVSMTRAIISRCRIFNFEKLTVTDIKKGLLRALKDENKGLGEYPVEIEDAALNHFAWIAGGDMRTALNALELAVLTTLPDESGKIRVTLKVAEQCVDRKAISVDDSLYYDILSAFCKSLRGSDADAALYYSERLIQAGCAPLLIARRLIAHSAEDVGMADPQALTIAISALTAIEKLGLPEGRIPLAEAIIYVAEAPKSNSVINALGAAEEAAKHRPDDNVPLYLCDVNYKGDEKPTGYKYPHNYGGWVEQQYLPDSLKDDIYYVPSQNGNEKNIKRIKLQRKGD